MRLNKLFALVPASDELVADSTAASVYLAELFVLLGARTARNRHRDQAGGQQHLSRLRAHRRIRRVRLSQTPEQRLPLRTDPIDRHPQK